MNKFWLFFPLLGVVSACATTNVTVKQTHVVEPCVTIASWNDLHGYLTHDWIHIETNKIPTGGVVALADEIARARKEHSSLVLLDGGDLFTGPMASTMAEGEPVIAAYNVLGVDAVTVGNHEFDFGPVGYERVRAADRTGDEAGPNGPRGALSARMHKAAFPFVSANIVYKSGQAPNWPNFKASHVIERGGFRVGVVGYSTQSTPATTLKPNVHDLDFSSFAVERVKNEIKSLRSQGAAPVVLLAHASIEGELPQSLTDADRADAPGEISSLLGALGEALPDLVVAGHRHAWMLGKIRGVPIVSSAHHAVGVTYSQFCKKTDSTLSLVSIERRTVLAHTPPHSKLAQSVQNVIQPWLDKTSGQASAVIAHHERTCAAQNGRGSALAEQVARAIWKKVDMVAKVPTGTKAIALVNSGGIRAPIPAGDVLFSHAFATLPFENAIAVCGTTLKGAKQVIQRALDRVSSARDRFPFGLAGAQVHLSREHGKLQLQSLTLADASEGEQAQMPTEDSPVWLVLPDFLLWGGDGMLKIPCEPSLSSSIRIREAWIELFKKEQRCDGVARNVHFMQVPDEKHE